jgi:hypothetical protein
MSSCAFRKAFGKIEITNKMISAFGLLSGKYDIIIGVKVTTKGNSNMLLRATMKKSQVGEVFVSVLRPFIDFVRCGASSHHQR